MQRDRRDRARRKALFDEFCARFPYEETDDQLHAIADVLEDLGVGQADGPADLRRRRLRQDRGGAARRLRGGDERPAGRGRRARRRCWRASTQDLHRALRGLAGAGAAACRAWSPPRRPRRPARRSRRARSRSSSAPTRCSAKQVEFKNLGLVIVDEEQHFGVKHKEKLKELRADVHMLTLTATPIPRTLQMSLPGIREMSIIATPPVDRLAVRTYITPLDRGRDPRGAAAREVPRRPGLLCLPAHRGPAALGAIPREQVPEMKFGGRPRPDGADPARRGDERLLRRPVRRAAVDHHRRERASTSRPPTP